MKPASSTPLNMGSARSFPRDTWEWNKSPAVLRGYPCVTRTGTFSPGRASLSGCIGLHLILYSIHRTATDRWWAMSHSNTPPVTNRAPQSARSSSLRCVLAAKHHTAEQYSKIGRTKQRKHLSRSDLSWNTCHGFLKILSLWEAALETKHRCFSNVILESNVTPNITRSLDSFSTVLYETWRLS